MHWWCNFVLGHFSRFISFPSPTSNLNSQKKGNWSDQENISHWNTTNSKHLVCNIRDELLTSRRKAESFRSKTTNHNRSASCGHNDVVDQSTEKENEESIATSYENLAYMKENHLFAQLTASSQCCRANFWAFSSLDNPFPTLAALVRALAHRETAVSGFSTLKNETELLFKAAKSNAFHLHTCTIFVQ